MLNKTGIQILVFVSRNFPFSKGVAQTLPRAGSFSPSMFESETFPALRLDYTASNQEINDMDERFALFCFRGLNAMHNSCRDKAYLSGKLQKQLRKTEGSLELAKMMQERCLLIRCGIAEFEQLRIICFSMKNLDEDEVSDRVFDLTDVEQRTRVKVVPSVKGKYAFVKWENGRLDWERDDESGFLLPVFSSYGANFLDENIVERVKAQRAQQVQIQDMVKKQLLRFLETDLKRPREQEAAMFPLQIKESRRFHEDNFVHRHRMHLLRKQVVSALQDWERIRRQMLTNDLALEVLKSKLPQSFSVPHYFDLDLLHQFSRMNLIPLVPSQDHPLVSVSLLEVAHTYELFLKNRVLWLQSRCSNISWDSDVPVPNDVWLFLPLMQSDCNLLFARIFEYLYGSFRRSFRRKFEPLKQKLETWIRFELLRETTEKEFHPSKIDFNLTESIFK